MNDSDTATMPTIEVAVRTDEQTEVEPQYTLIMGDSDTHTVQWVVDVCIEIFAMTREQGIGVASAIHHQKQSPVFKGTWNECILKRDQVRSKGGDALAESINIASRNAIPIWIEEA